MTSLQLLIQDLNLSEVDVMNQLQDHGIISDLCVWAADVGGGDRLLAVDWVIEKYIF